MNHPAEWIAALLSILGAWLVGSQSADHRTVGFLLFLAANTIWIAWGIAIGAWPLVAMQSIFLITSARGAWVNSHG